MGILSFKAPTFRTLMRILYHRKWGYRGLAPPGSNVTSPLSASDVAHLLTPTVGVRSPLSPSDQQKAPSVTVGEKRRLGGDRKDRVVATHHCMMRQLVYDPWSQSPMLQNRHLSGLFSRVFRS